jgi:hypothetical protein
VTLYKNPDKKKALSMIEASKRDMEFTLSIKITENSASTIMRNIYECFRMLGDALLVARGLRSQDHIEPVRELLKLDVRTKRPINLIDNLRRSRHNINYYGYRPDVAEVQYAISIAETLFEPLFRAVKEKIGQ